MKQFLTNALRGCSALLLLVIAGTAVAQKESTLTGTVTDGSRPLPGANIIVEGSSKGVAADSNGRYVLTMPPGLYKLQASYAGYGPLQKTITVTSGGRNRLDFVLTIDKMMEEVTVAYGKQRAKLVTGALATVSASVLEDQPVMQFAQQLQGRVAGVNIGLYSGQPGRGVEFRIRGAASLLSGNQPLFVIDGMPVTGSINNINPSEIESFTVLKDASASVLYGSRAANGVVLITTKHAKGSGTSVDVNASYGVQKIPGNRVPKPMDAQQFAQFMKQRFEDRAKYEKYTGGIPAVYQNPDQYGVGTDWYSLLTQTAPIQSYDVAIRSAREKSSTTALLGYQSQEGVLVNTGTQLFSGRLNHDIVLGNNKLKMGVNIAPSYRIDHNNRLSTDGVGGLFERLFEASPLIAPFDSLGNYNKFVFSDGMVSYLNPLALFKQTRDDYYTTRILGNAYFDYEILKGLRFKDNFGVDKGMETRVYFAPSITNSNSIASGTSSSVDNYSWTNELTLDYTRRFKEHSLQLLAGYAAQRFTQLSNAVSGTDYPLDDVPYIAAATTISAGSSNTTAYSMLSQIGRLNYNFKDKYLLQAAVRRDGSSRFGADRRYGAFPSVSAGWIVSEEPFMQQVPWISFLKLRGGYGLTGNNNFANYQAQTTIGRSNYIIGGSVVPGLAISNLGNSDLAWERNKQLDIGLDVSLFNSRVSFTYDYYNKISDGMIMDRPIPQASGFSSIKYNVGVIKFWGHEFTVNTVNIDHPDLKWNSSVTVSIDRNVIKDLVSPGFIRRNNTVSSDYYRQQTGHPLGAFYGFVYEGLYKDSADLMSSARYTKSDVGTIKVKDINGDGVIDDVNDRTFIGDPTPAFTFGFFNDFKYKNIDLSLSMAGSVGGKMLNAAKWAYQTNMDGSRVPLAAALDYWRSPENPGSGVYPRTETGTTVMGRQVNSQWIENGSYLTLKNITLGYTFNIKRELLIKKCRIYGSVQQAFVLTKYTGMNPEVNVSGSDASGGVGIDENAYPIPRTFALGVSLSFK